MKDVVRNLSLGIFTLRKFINRGFASFILLAIIPLTAEIARADYSVTNAQIGGYQDSYAAGTARLPRSGYTLQFKLKGFNANDRFTSITAWGHFLENNADTVEQFEQISLSRSSSTSGDTYSVSFHSNGGFVPLEYLDIYGFNARTGKWEAYSSYVINGTLYFDRRWAY